MNIISVFVLDFSNEHIMLFHNSSSIQEFQDFEQQVVNSLTDKELSLGGSHVIGNNHIKTPDELKAYDPFFIHNWREYPHFDKWGMNRHYFVIMNNSQILP